MVRVLIASLAGGLTLFVCGFISWVVLEDFHKTDGWALTNEEEVVTAIANGGNPAGTYWLPGAPEGYDQEEWNTRHRAGPRGFLVYHPEGAEPMPPMMFVKGFVLSVLAAFVAALLMKSSRRGFTGRVAIAALLGVFVALAADAMMWNYMMFLDDFTLVAAADHIISWIVVGIVMASIIRYDPKTVEVATA